jgi:hypothetical protein
LRTKQDQHTQNQGQRTKQQHQQQQQLSASKQKPVRGEVADLLSVKSIMSFSFAVV